MSGNSTHEILLDDQRRRLVTAKGHLLVTGGPGSGKTTIALLKAGAHIDGSCMAPSQRVLFLSFARATVSRIMERAGTLLSKCAREQVETNTYHGFAWSLLRAHGYLLRENRRLSLLPPPEAAALLAGLGGTARQQEIDRLFAETGRVHFDIFAKQAGALLHGSARLRKLIASAYPLVIVDEFQDTNSDQWAVVRALGESSSIMALADPDQRIYEFQGADPKRIPEFVDRFSPEVFDFGSENSRSAGTDIADFGNDVLRGVNRIRTYNDVSVVHYVPRKAFGPHYELKIQTLAARRRLQRDVGEESSLAVLVASNTLMLQVSGYLGTSTDRLPAVSHRVAIDSAGPSLAAIVIAGLLEGGETEVMLERLFSDVEALVRGGTASVGKPLSQKVCQFTERLRESRASDVRAKSAAGKLRAEVESVVLGVQRIDFSGDPECDWLLVRALFERSTVVELQDVAKHARHLRFLHKRAALRGRLGELWRTQASYAGARKVIQDALRDEHFSWTKEEPRGVHVMTIHKAKGREFDEVIIYEGWKVGRFLPEQADAAREQQARLMLRVAVTRARRRCAILTPKGDPSSLLI